MKEDDIGYWLKLISDKIKTNVDMTLRDRGLTLSQVRLLVFVFECGGETTQKKIEDYLNVSHPTVTGLVSRLEKKGFLDCFTDRNDQRNKVVRATQQALSVNEELSRARQQVEKSLTANLSERELSELYRLLRILYENVNHISCK